MMAKEWCNENLQGAFTATTLDGHGTWKWKRGPIPQRWTDDHLTFSSEISISFRTADALWIKIAHLKLLDNYFTLIFEMLSGHSSFPIYLYINISIYIYYMVYWKIIHTYNYIMIYLKGFNFSIFKTSQEKTTKNNGPCRFSAPNAPPNPPPVASVVWPLPSLSEGTPEIFFEAKKC